MFRPAALSQDLLPRAISGIVLAAVALASNWAGHWPFFLVVLAVGLLMSWEWSRIVRSASDGAFILHALGVGAGTVLASMGMPLAGCGMIIASAIFVGLLATSQKLLSMVGVVYVGLPAISLIWLRGADDFGALAILFVFIVVWMTDTFAYVCGRLLGGAKLWPAVSPGKTWSGTIGGLVFAAITGAIFAMSVPRSSMLVLAGVAVVLSVVSQAGDLAESALKRAFKVKNASELIPGHGGFMDRMDGVVAAAAVAALIAAARGAASPAHALLIWS